MPDADIKQGVADGTRWRWLKMQIESKDLMVRAQALMWNASSPKHFEQLVDEAMREQRTEAVGAFVAFTQDWQR